MYLLEALYRILEAPACMVRDLLEAPYRRLEAPAWSLWLDAPVRGSVQEARGTGLDAVWLEWHLSEVVYRGYRHRLGAEEVEALEAVYRRLVTPDWMCGARK